MFSSSKKSGLLLNSASQLTGQSSGKSAVSGLSEHENGSQVDIDFELGLANAEKSQVVDKERHLTMQEADLLAELTGETSQNVPPQMPPSLGMVKK